MIDRLSTAVHTFSRHILISLSVDETQLMRYVNLPTNFGELSIWSLDGSFSFKAHVLSFVSVHMKADASNCLLQAMQ